MKIKFNCYTEQYFIELKEIGDYDNIASIINCFCDENNIVLFSFWSKYVRNKSEIMQNFILERVACKNRINVSKRPLLVQKSMPLILWLKPRNFEEINSMVGFNFFFESIIIDNNLDFNNIKYVIELYEQMGGIDGFSLAITEKKEGDFRNRVVPNLEKLYTVTFE